MFKVSVSCLFCLGSKVMSVEGQCLDYVNYQVLPCFFFLLSSNKHCILLIGWHIYLRAAFIGNYLLPSTFSRGQHVIKEKKVFTHYSLNSCTVMCACNASYSVSCITSWPLYISFIIISLHSTSDSC